MSEIHEHDINSLATIEGKLYEYESPPHPGDLVRFYLDPKSTGTVIGPGNEKHTVRVLWARFDNPLSGFVRKVNVPYAKIASELVDVQPMSLPSSLIFYLDHQFGEGKKEEE